MAKLRTSKDLESGLPGSGPRRMLCVDRRVRQAQPECSGVCCWLESQTEVTAEQRLASPGLTQTHLVYTVKVQLAMPLAYPSRDRLVRKENGGCLVTCIFLRSNGNFFHYKHIPVVCLKLTHA